MFIRKSQYRELCGMVDVLLDRLAVLTNKFVEFRDAEADMMFGLINDIDKLKDKCNDLTDIAELERESFKKQKEMEIGLQNIMKY